MVIIWHHEIGGNSGNISSSEGILGIPVHMMSETMEFPSGLIVSDVFRYPIIRKVHALTVHACQVYVTGYTNY